MSQINYFEQDLDDVIGFLHIKDLAFIRNGEREKFNIRDHLKDPFFIFIPSFHPHLARPYFYSLTHPKNLA